MFDSLGRKIEYLRISVTEKCNLNCIYCKSDDSDNFECKKMISAEEYGLIAHAMAAVGITKVRITGGEPLLRQDICEIVRAVAKAPGIEDISLTTNGIMLGEMAARLKDAGLKRVNISLDSLKESSFRHITGSSCLNRVLEGIKNSLEVGLRPVKLNTVLIKGINDGEIDDLIGLAKDLPIDVRFIELMPIGSFGEKNSEKIVYSSEIIENRPYLEKIENVKDRQPAEYYRISGYKGRIGFISPMGHRFCGDCNRIRLTCDGKIKLCLGHNSEVDLMEVLRETPENLEEFIERTVFLKPAGHNFENSFSSSRSMNAIGG